MYFILRLTMFCLLLTLASSCAPRKIPVERPPEAVWNQFRSGIEKFSPEQSFLISASVIYIAPGQRNRVQSSLWGRIGYPVRMDLTAGFGQIIAMWYEDEQIWEAYFPGENVKYIHHDGALGASMLGYPTPLDLGRTAKVLLGAFGDLVPENYTRVGSSDGMWEYFFRDNEVQSMIIDQGGSVYSISGQNWKVEFSAIRVEDSFQYYSRMDMKFADDQRAQIRIRSIRIDDPVWDEDQLELIIPADAGVVFLPDLSQ